MQAQISIYKKVTELEGKLNALHSEKERLLTYIKQLEETVTKADVSLTRVLLNFKGK